MPGHPDFSGTALVHQSNTLLGPNLTFTVGPGADVLHQVDIFRPGYLFAINITCPVGTAVPFADVQFLWQDPTTAVNLDFQDWVIPATQSGKYPITAQGPVRGPHLDIFVNNLDSVQTMTVTMTLLDTTHAIARDDWRALPGGVIPGFARPPIDKMWYNQLFGSTTLNLPATSTNNFLLPLYAGQAWFTWSANGVAGSDIAINVINATGAAASFYSYPQTAATGQIIAPFPITLPRYPCILSLINAGTAATTFAGSLVAQEYAS